MSRDGHTIHGDAITATILAHGAELCSLKNAQGQELLWQAGEVWPRHAPLLFPIVGKLKNDELHHRGKSYPMTQIVFSMDSPGMDPRHMRSSLELFAKEVIPHLRNR